MGCGASSVGQDRPLVIPRKRAKLKKEAGRSRKQRRTVKQMYVDLKALGYIGSYNRVAAFAPSGKSSVW